MDNQLSIEQRIAQIVQSANFMDFCIHESNSNQLMQHFNTYLKLAKINTNGISVNRELFNIYLTPQQVANQTVNFYEWLDSVCPSRPLTPTVKDNLQHVTYNINRLPKGAQSDRPRAGCGHIIDNGELIDCWIFLEDKADIRDALASAHEHMHGLSKHFKTGKPYKDASMGEFIPVMVDELSLCFLEMKTGNKELAKEIRKSRIELCVGKAKRSLLDYFVVSVMAKNCSPQEKLKQFNEIRQQYGHLISEKDLVEVITSIENKTYQPLFEAKYIFAQLASMHIGEKFQQIMYYKEHGTPDQVEMAKAEEFRIVSTLKDILEKDTELTLDEALNMLCLPPKEIMVDGYNQRFTGKGM